MYSSEGERVQLIQNISTSEAKGAVEKWLVQVEDLMLRSVRDVVARSRLVRSLFPLASMYSSSDTGFLDWILILGMTKGRLSFDLQAHIFHHAGLDFIFCSFAASHVPERNLWMWMCSCFIFGPTSPGSTDKQCANIPPPTQVEESLLRTCWNTILVVRALPWTIWQPSLTLYWQAYAETSRSQWVKDWPGQVVLCTSQIYWTLEVHEAIQAGPNVGFFHHYFI